MGIEEVFLIVIALVLPIFSIFDLVNDSSMKKYQVLWAILIILVPFFGPLAYLIYSRCIFFFGTKAQ